MKILLCLFAFFALAAAQASAADDGDQAAQIAALKAQVAELQAQNSAFEATITVLSKNQGCQSPAAPASSNASWICEAECVGDLVGPGFTMGMAEQFHIMVNGPDAKTAYNAMPAACEADMQAALLKNNQTYKQYKIDGYVPFSTWQKNGGENVTIGDLNGNDGNSYKAFCTNTDAPVLNFTTRVGVEGSDHLQHQDGNAE